MKVICTLTLLSVTGLAAASAQAGSVLDLPTTPTVNLSDNNDGTGTTTADDAILVFEEYAGLTLGDVRSHVGAASGYQEFGGSLANEMPVSIYYLHYDPDHATGGDLNITLDLGSTILGFIGTDALMDRFDSYAGVMPSGAVYLPGSSVTSIVYPTGRSGRGAGPAGGGNEDITTIAGSSITLDWRVPSRAAIDTARVIVLNQIDAPPVVPSPAAAGAGCVLMGLLGLRRSRA
jgi:hypothetical protein